MDYLDLVEKEVRESEEELLSTGGADDFQIAEFESLLGIIFPQTYKAFLSKYGAMSFCGDTYYGITSKGKDEAQVPCIQFITNSARARGDVSNRMVVIKSSGYGPVYSIDADTIGSIGEPVIVETKLSYKRTKEKRVVADNYGAFLLSEIKNSIQDL